VDTLLQSVDSLHSLLLLQGNYYFLGSMDHLLSRPGVVSTTNKDSITISRCSALYELMKFNIGSWMIALFLGGLVYAVVLESLDWKMDALPGTVFRPNCCSVYLCLCRSDHSQPLYTWLAFFIAEARN
jgi:hypothetical protein